MALQNTGEQYIQRVGVWNHNAAYTAFCYLRRDADLDTWGHFLAVADGYAYNANVDFIGLNNDGTTFRWGCAGGTGGPTFNTGPTITAGQWYWAAIVRESATSLNIYLGTNGSDGSLLATITDDVSGRAAAGAAFALSYAGLPAAGSMAHVRIWTRALTLAELHAEAVSATPASSTSIWSVPAMAGADLAAALQDTTANDRDWTAVGTPAIVAGPTLGGPQPISIGQAVETDSAQPLDTSNLADEGDLFIVGDDASNNSTLGGPNVIGGFPSAAGGAVTISIGQAAETNTAQPVAAAQRRVIGQAVEAESALPVVARQVAVIGIATESDTAQPMGVRLSVAIGQASESDVALAVGGASTASIGQAIEVDSARPFLSLQARSIGQTVETDTAQPVGRLQVATISQAQESDLAQQLGAAGAVAIGLSNEFDSAHAFARSESRSIGQAQELDAAQPVAASLLRAAGMALEIDAAGAIQAAVARAIGQVAELDTAQPFGVLAPISGAIGQAVEFDSALAVFAFGGEAADPSTAYRYDVPGLSLRLDVPGLGLRYDVPRASLRFDVPGAWFGIAAH